MYTGSKKIYIKNKIRFSIFLIIISLFIMTIINSFFLHKVKGYESSNFKVITIDAGETLWDIVSEYSSGKYDIREEIYHIKKMNHLETSYLYPGQELIVPIRE